MKSVSRIKAKTLLNILKPLDEHRGEPKAVRNIFVFGSNLNGYHGAGSAKHAFDSCGATWGRGVGLSGDSYAIPTKDRNISVLPLHRIKPFVDDFLNFAAAHKEMHFEIVAVGCGLAGYSPEEIAPLFKSAPDNCSLPSVFVKVLKKG